MRNRIVRFLGWLIRVAGALARRLIGAMAAMFVGLFLLVAAIVLVNFNVLHEDIGDLARFLIGAAILLIGTVINMLIGFIFPGPFLALLDAFDWLPTPDGGGDGGFDLFGGDD